MSSKRRDSWHYLRVLNRFATEIIALRDEEDLARYITSQIVSNLDFEDCVVYLVSPTGNVLRQISALGPKSPDGKTIEEPIAIPMGEGIVGSVASSGKHAIVSDVTKDSRYICDIVQGASEITVPIVVEGKVCGVIDCEDRRPGFFDDSHMEILTTIAGFAASKIREIRIARKAARQTVLIMELQEAIFLLNEKGDILECNPAAIKMFGRNRNELTSGNLKLIFENHKEWQQNMNMLAASKRKKKVSGFGKAFTGGSGTKDIGLSLSTLPGENKGEIVFFLLARKAS